MLAQKKIPLGSTGLIPKELCEGLAGLLNERTNKKASVVPISAYIQTHSESRAGCPNYGPYTILHGK